MKELICDVLVIGAGPAGLGSAISASIDNKVLCIDQKISIGENIKCAEGVGFYLFDLLPFKIPKYLLEWKISGMSFNFEAKKIFRGDKLWGGYSINRQKFELWLAKKASNNGVKFLLNSKIVDIVYNSNFVIAYVVINSSGKLYKIKPKFVIAADGTKSFILNFLNLVNKDVQYISVLNFEIGNIKNLKDNKYEQFYFGEFGDKSFAYIFPKSKNSANIGIGGFEPLFKLKISFKNFLNMAYIKNQLGNYKVIKDKSKEAPFSDLCNKLVYGNIYIVGDAANQNIKPFIEGFLPSLICGYNLGSIIAEHPTDEDYKYKINKILPHIDQSKKFIQSIRTAFLIKNKHIRNKILFLLMSNSYDSEYLITTFLNSRKSINKILLDELVSAAK